MIYDSDIDLGMSLQVLSAHPSNEVLGCAGIIPRQADSRDQI